MLPIVSHINVYCKKCDEVILYSTILRHDSFSNPVEQKIYGTYCPICGNKLEPYSSIINEGMYN